MSDFYTSNAYVSVQNANNYFSVNVNSKKWNINSDEMKISALKQATDHIDNHEFFGVKTDDTQYLKFPRNLSTDIPKNISIACCEEALAILNLVNDKRNDLIESGVKKRKIYDVEETYAEKNNSIDMFSVYAFKLISQYIKWSYK